MKKFRLTHELESVPKIIGIRSVYAFYAFIILVVLLGFVFVGFTVWKLILAIFAMGGSYIFLLIKTEAFQANSTKDAKFPDIISNNPNQ